MRQFLCHLNFYWKTFNPQHFCSISKQKPSKKLDDSLKGIPCYKTVPVNHDAGQPHPETMKLKPSP
jgi:hypothetical protein